MLVKLIYGLTQIPQGKVQFAYLHKSLHTHTLSYLKIDVIRYGLDFRHSQLFGGLHLSQTNLTQHIVRRLVILECGSVVSPEFGVVCNLEMMPDGKNLLCAFGKIAFLVIFLNAPPFILIKGFAYFYQQFIESACN